jgi:urate oxidase
MHLSHFTYGKGRVRVMRVKRDTNLHEVRELDLKIMLEGDFAASFLSSDNTKVIATDSIKNIANIVARAHPATDTEPYTIALADYFLGHYPHVSHVRITAHETKWDRLTINGTPHDHAFQKDANGQNTAHLTASRIAQTLTSGVAGFTFLKTTASGWVGYLMDEATTLPETTDRIFSTAMDANWTWAKTPENYPEANAKILAAMMDVFATTYSPSVQNTLYLMGSAALAAVPEITTIVLACPNKHYLPINLKPFGLDNPNLVFTPTDEPHGQIECKLSRSD